MQARGIGVQRAAAAALGRVIVVAVTREQSTSAHSITIDRPLRHIERDVDVHSIDGTPTDCTTWQPYAAFQ
ncbi:MAG TPA: 5'/3'-nucleotidase SurE [Polyangiales bacterium]|nr:5'/3'-nucleotidase SurE [Polyangiales bacterium]